MNIIKMTENLVNNRKQQLDEYRGLFLALFKIPDKDVQRRVIDAINGVCHHDRHNHNTVDSSTQTDQNDLLEKVITKVKSTDEISDSKDFVLNFNKHKNQKSNTKRRRRNLKVPRVEKHDGRNEIQKQLKTRITTLQRNLEKIKQFDPSDLLDCFNMPEIEYTEAQLLKLDSREVTKIDVLRQMIAEWKECETYDGDYLPIHMAILQNDINKFKRQCYVFSRKKKNISDLLTKNCETPLQLALKSDSYNVIINTLFEHETNFLQIDENGNTLVHLVTHYTDNIEILEKILNKFEFNLISKCNYNGRTALHTAVILNKFKMCKLLLEFINSKLNIDSIGQHINDEKKLEEIFIQELNIIPRKKRMKINEIKYDLVNQKNSKHGRTSLFYALENNSKLITFLLLLNFADPNIEDGSGLNCIAYAKDSIEKTICTEILTSLQSTADYINKCNRL